MVLPGHLAKNGDVTLGDLSEAHLARLVASDAARLYEWEDPWVFMRITPQLAPCLREKPRTLAPKATDEPQNPGVRVLEMTATRSPSALPPRRCPDLVRLNS